ncbi:hypothetical protein CVT26_007444 [Gymnopilus dilepis]|uniref:Uncharacterized protein n=1 Tax=Gymnopilus dilepis TaxID=231916 RepID=A0A409W840_9AGAR|nr:hypothetical protein CVT26_007444 [Gymnopilus dilepis]
MDQHPFLGSDSGEYLLYIIEHLTRPLIEKENLTTIYVIKSVLLAALFQFMEDNARPVTMTLSSTSTPPRPILSACIAAGLPWTRWMKHLGGQGFRLTIDEDNNLSFTSLEAESDLPSSSPSKTASTRHRLPSTIFRHSGPVPKRIDEGKFATSDTIGPHSSPRTLAQHLLSVDEDKDAAEIFALISRSSAMALPPTPTGDAYPLDRSKSMSIPRFSLAARPPLLSPQITGSSRPYSPFSSSSLSSDGYSSATAFSFSIPNDLLGSPPDIMTSLANATGSSTTENKGTKIYLYHGGSSTVLTGGVMLG